MANDHLASHEPTVQSLFDLSGKTALITGASGHLGSAMARGLVEAGARVIVASRDAKLAASFASDLPDPNGVGHSGVEIDHMDAASVERGFKQAAEQSESIDILVNNGHEGLPHDWTDVTAEQFTRQLANATGYFLLARHLHDHAVQRSAPASIIMIGSMYGVVGSYPQAYEGLCAANPAAYQTLKGGVVQMTRHLAVYWAQKRVRVNYLSPGPFPPDTAPSEMIERLKQHSPMQRMGLAHELKGALVFLASEASSYMTGQNLMIDGGWTAW